MNWQAVGALGEVLGAAAVVASLVFLAVQVRSNTRAMRARAGFDATKVFAEMNENLARSVLADSVFQNGGEARFASMIATVFDPAGAPGALTPTERVIVDLIHRAIFEKLEATYYLYRHGYVESALWEQRRAWAEGFLSLPVPRDWWDCEVRQAVYGREFMEAILGGAKVDLTAPGTRTPSAKQDA